MFNRNSISRYFVSTMLAAVLLSCENEQTVDCSRHLIGKDGFMFHGGILDKYDNGRVFVSIQRINDPKDWAYNEYFTGDGFSTDRQELLKVIDGDSCKLKQKYFAYMEGH